MSSQSKKSVWTSANKVTFVRIILIPVFVAILVAEWPMYFPNIPELTVVKPWVAAFVFILLSLTDTLDGYLARSRNEITDFGKFMDPLADKLLVTAALLGLIELRVIPSWVALIIISREFIVSGARMVAASKGVVIAASIYGKIKTVFQMIAIVLFIVKDSHVIVDLVALSKDWLYIFSWVVMFIALAMTIISMIDYLYKARHLLGFGTGAMQDSDHASQVGAPSMKDLEDRAELLLDLAREKGAMLATAESCTGGLISATLTSIAGSSDVVAGGIVSYSNDVKHHVLGVDQQTLDSFGAVSEQTACEMALGALDQTGASLAVSVTGIAGPGGATPGKPVGTVWIGIADAAGARAFEQHFAGSREQVRMQTVEKSFALLEQALAAL